ncbi:glutathione S-transferase [Hyaloraphidium curvatum]|nr:glutathione S-transferase [Hyaloraphidium curvatum]
MAPKITLYFSIGSCSGASYMALSTVGADFETVQVDLKAHKTVDGRDYYTINPAGAVPALEVDGKILTENVAVLSYIADLKPEAKLLPPRGSWEYYKALEAVSLVATDLHKTIGALFNPALPAEVADFQKARFLKIVKRMDETLASQKWLVAGEDPTIGDYYANVVLSWTAFLKVDISEFKNVVAYQERFKAVPGIAAAMAEWMSGGKKK